MVNFGVNIVLVLLFKLCLISNMHKCKPGIYSGISLLPKFSSLELRKVIMANVAQKMGLVLILVSSPKMDKTNDNGSDLH